MFSFIRTRIFASSLSRSRVANQYSICSTSNIIVCAVKPPERKPSQEEEEIDDDEDNALKVCMEGKPKKSDFLRGQTTETPSSLVVFLFRP